jgi:hypothetical protein
MTPIHNGDLEREERLVKLLTGQIEPESEEGRAMLGSDPDLRAAFEEVKALSCRLDDMAESESAAVESLEDNLPDSPPVNKALEKIWKQEAQKAPPDSGSHRLLLLVSAGLAAAVILVLLITWWINKNESIDRPVRYLGGGITVTSPVGKVDRYEFAWQEYALPPGGYYVLFIYAGQGREQMWRGTETSWRPKPDERAGLPDRLDWWVEAYGPSDLDPIARSKTIILERSSK